ncbi:hypothetical protein G9A89_006005 [Geosiphon pyriformis]|nr:hypothetical protein G9A89_006005 [Geosiphon pyriformis]
MCFTRFLEKLNEGLIDELGVVKVCNDFILQGTESVASTIYWLIAILANNPKFQQKAHEELDRVVGHERLPNMSDFNSLPYIRSLVKETLRWVPPVTKHFYTLRFLEQDDEYLGYHIPKNSWICLNIYA